MALTQQSKSGSIQSAALPAFVVKKFIPNGDLVGEPLLMTGSLRGKVGLEEETKGGRRPGQRSHKQGGRTDLTTRSSKQTSTEYTQMKSEVLSLKEEVLSLQAKLIAKE